MPSEQLTARQHAANRLLGSGATHIMLYGGSRSGKTFLLVRAILKRAARVQSRHAIFRHRFNHLKASRKPMAIIHEGAARSRQGSHFGWAISAAEIGFDVANQIYILGGKATQADRRCSAFAAIYILGGKATQADRRCSAFAAMSEYLSGLAPELARGLAA